MPREGASLGAQTMPDNCQFLQGWKRRVKWEGNDWGHVDDSRHVSSVKWNKRRLELRQWSTFVRIWPLQR